MQQKLKKCIAMTILVFSISMSFVNNVQAVTTSSDTSELKYSRKLIGTGLTLTTIGALNVTAGLCLGSISLYWLAVIGPGDSAAWFGYPALVTFGVAVPFLTFGIPMLISGKQKRNSLNRLSVCLPAPFILPSVYNKHKQTYRARYSSLEIQF